MDRRTRHNSIVAIWLAVFFLIGYGVWSFQGGELMLIGYLGASIVAYGITAFLYRCPKCRVPVLLRPRRFLGMDIYTWSCFAPSSCRHCGAKL